ncbi:MAG: hypothetical protein ABII27_08770 [bacterium]
MSEENKQRPPIPEPMENKSQSESSGNDSSEESKDEKNQIYSIIDEHSPNKWRDVLAALEKKLTEEREIFQSKFKEMKESYDSLRMRLENREKELLNELERYKENNKLLEEKKAVIIRKNKEDSDKVTDEWEARIKAKDNEIFAVRNELNVIHNRSEEEARSMRQQISNLQDENRKIIDIKDREIVSLTEDRARLQGKIVQRETELKSEFERTIFDMEKRLRSTLESEINRLKLRLEQEKTTNDVLQIKLKEMAALRSDNEFKDSQIKNLYNEKVSLEKMRKDTADEMHSFRVEFDKEREKWEKMLDERNINIKDILKEKDYLINQVEAYKQEVKEIQLKNESREKEWDRQRDELEEKVMEKSKRISDLDANLTQSQAQIDSLVREKQTEQERIDKALSSDLNRVLARLELERTTLESDMGHAVTGDISVEEQNKEGEK